jgi:hypothetical protein
MSPLHDRLARQLATFEEHQGAIARYPALAAVLRAPLLALHRGLYAIEVDHETVAVPGVSIRLHDETSHTVLFGDPDESARFADLIADAAACRPPARNLPFPIRLKEAT